MERGANPFPFHNLLPYSESNEGLFLYFLPSLNWIKEKSVATLAIRTFAIQKSTKSVHRITTISKFAYELNHHKDHSPSMTVDVAYEYMISSLSCYLQKVMIVPMNLLRYPYMLPSMTI